jgi:PAS domain-containing protein
VKREGRDTASKAEQFPVDALQLRRIVDSGVVALVCWDLSGQICEANDRFLEIVGYDRGDLGMRRLSWSRLIGFCRSWWM